MHDKTGVAVPQHIPDPIQSECLVHVGASVYALTTNRQKKIKSKVFI